MTARWSGFSISIRAFRRSLDRDCRRSCRWVYPERCAGAFAGSRCPPGAPGRTGSTLLYWGESEGRSTMGDMTIKGVDDAVLQELRSQADRHGMAPELYARDLLRQALTLRRGNRA